MITRKLDAFEAQRLIDKLKMEKSAQLSFDDTMDMFSQLLEEDVDELIAQGFNKLDITNEGKVSVRTIHRALLTN